MLICSLMIKYFIYLQHLITILNIILNALQLYFHIQIARTQLENKQTFINIDITVHET